MTTMPWLTLFPSRHASAASARVSGDRRRRLWRLALAGLAAALPLQALGPAVTGQAPSGVTGAAALTTLTLSFNQALVPARARQPAAYELLHLGANRAVGGGDDQAVALTPAYVDGALEVALTSAAPLAEGLYRLTVRSDATYGLQNLAAELLDQNQDGTPDSYVASLEVDLTPPAVSGVAAGTCLVYDDGYDMVTLPHEALNGLAAYTLELWFQTTKTNGQSLIGAIQSGNTAAVQFWLTNGTLYVESASSSVSATLDGVYDGRWHHLAVTYSDAANRMEIIYDGRLLTSAGYTGGPPSVAPGAFIVGQEQDAPGTAMDAGQAFIGALTELRLWDYARTPAEVAAMRFQRAAGDEAGLRACWHFDEGTTTVTDATGNGFDGVLGDWNSGDLPRWQPATAWWNDHRTLHVTYLDIGGMDSASVQDTANYTILASGGDGIFDDGNEVDLTASLQSVAYVPATRGAVLVFDATLPQDMVQVTIRGTGTVRDAAGHALLGGNDYVSPGVPVALGVPPLTAVVAPATDTGFSDTDGITSQTQPGFQVTVDQPGTIAVDSARNGSWEAVREVTAAGSWRVDAITPFADGATTVPVRFTSWLGAVATTSVALTVDTTPPQVGAVTAGTALSFDGSNDYVVTTAKTWGFTTSATLAAWVKTTDDTGTLISLAHGDVNNELLLLISGGKAQVIQHKQPGSYWYRNGTSVINLGRWVHVAAVFDGTGVNAMRVFVNGIEEPLGTTGQAGSPAAVSDAAPRWVTLGARIRNGYRSEHLAGQIDEAQVWSRALTPAEVAALVATAPVGNEPGLAGLWRLNEGVGTDVDDAVAGYYGIFGAGVAAESPTWVAAPLPGPRRTLRISYSDSQAMDQASVIDVGNYLLTASGGDGVFGNGNDIDRSADLVDISYDAATRTATLRCDPAIAGDAFRLTVRGTTTVRDAAGNALAGGQDVASAPLGIPAVPPRVTATLDPASDSGLDTADRLTSDTTPTLQVTATDAGLIEVYRDGVAVPGWSQAVTGAGTVALTPPEPLAGGSHRLSVVFTPWIGEPTQTTLDLFIDDGGPRVTAVDGPVPTPCFSRTIHFDRPVRVADLSPDQVEVRNGDGTLRAMATAVTPLWPGLKQNPGTGTWYLPVLRREGVTWFGAEAEAKRLGGALVSIADGNEMTFVRSLVADVSFWRHAPGAPSIGPWIGLRREAGVAGAYFHWYWPDGAAMVYTYWGSNQPDNRDGQHWAVHLGGDYAYWYDNAPTTLAPGFVVEFAAAPVVASSFRIDFESLPGGADYSLVFGPGVRDAAGNPMDQDDDGTPGEAVADAWADAFTVPAPADGLQIVRALPTGADPAAPFRHLEVVFNRPVDAGSVAAADAVLTPAGGGAAIIAASFVPADSHRWLLDFGAAATGQAYDLAVGPQITAGSVAMDQDGDGTPGEALDDVFRARLQKSALALGAGDATLDDIHIVFWGGSHVIDGAHRLAGLFLLNGAVLSHSPCTAGAVFALDLEVTGTVRIDATSAIDVTNRGYLPGRTRGNLPAEPALGAASGSHGGLGRTGTSGGSVPPAYGNFADPDEPGGGGNQTAGGGLVRLQAGVVLLDGRIVAHGGDCVGDGSASAGAGGGILVRTGILGGAGLIGADGGAGTGGYYGYYGGSGGGGRVALYYDTLAGFDPATQARAVSRNFPIGPGAAGTVFLQPGGGANQLRIDSQGTPVGQTTPLLAADGGDAVVVDTLVIAGPGVLAETPPGVGVVADDVAILNGATLTHAACTAVLTNRLDLTVSGTLLVDPTAAIDVSGRGYLPGRSVGNVPPTPEQKSFGGSHGGLGRIGSWGGTVPASYDDIRDPALPGGGGSGTAGGGVVRIHAGTIVLEGAIRANGVSGWGGISGGAGGSVRVQTDVLSGAGSVSADGGAAGMGDYASTGGSGGGGRVAIYYGSLDGFDVAGRVSAHSAASPAGPGSVGTVYLQPAGGVSELRIVSHGIATGSWTPLLPGPDGWVRLGSLTIAGAGVEVAAMDGAPIDGVDIAVLDGANLTHPSPSATATFALEVHASGTLHVDATSRIDVSGRGSPGGTTLGVRALGSSKGRAGGSYGGKGYGNASNSLYGRPDNPLWPGSGGNTAGGGLVRLHAAAMQIDGAVRANGVHGAYYWAMAAGSGGGILMNTLDWAGAGVVEALGGNGNWGDYGSNGGSGGGGRIAVYVAGQQAVSVPALSAAGGSGGSGIGGAGTAVLYTAPSFFWTDPRPAVAGAEVSLGWELLGAPAGTTVDLFAGPAGGDQAPLAAALPPVGSHLWDTSALPSGLYTLRLAYGAAGGAVAGEATRTVLVHHEGLLHGGRLASDEAWAAGVLHIVTDDLEIPSGVTLTVAAGALVKVAEGRRLRVLPGGALVSGGTPGAPAVFTSLRDDSLGGDDNADGALTSPAPGDWGGILVEDGTALPASDVLVLRYGTREHGGSLAASAVWRADTLHWVRDDVTVPGGMTLTVEPGATVVFDYGRVLSVSGTLQAIGAVGAPIRMVSSYDSGAFGMAYGPYAGHMPAPGDWHCVYVGAGGVGTFDRVHFRHGGGRQTGYDSTAMVRGRSSTVVLQNCRIEDTQYDGVLVDWPTNTTRTELVNCVVAGCDIGFRAADNAAGICQVVNSSFYDNRIGVHLAWGSTSNPRVVRNSIIAASREIGYYLWGGGTVFESNNVWGSGTTNYLGGLADQTGKNGNISADPRFRTPDQGDLNLMPTSPCIDAANGTYAPATDLAGLPRNDFPRVPDTGVPMPGGVVVPDMGALEYSQHVNTNIDLVVTAVRGPALATAGDAVTVSWEVANRGTEEVSGWRRDRVGLATAAQQRGEVSLTCGTAAFTDTIRPGQTVTYEAVVTVPGGTPGVWNWSVTTNAFDDVAEGANRVNNTGLSARTVTLGLPALVLNAPTAVSGQLGAAGAAAWYAVTIPAGQDAIIRVDAGAGDARLRLYAGRGFLPTIYDYDWQSPASGADPRLALPASSGEQTLYVLVVAEALPSGPTTFTATAAELVFALDACDRRSGGNAGNTTVRLTGAGFTPDLAVGLRGVGGTIPATGVTVLNSGEAYAVLDLNGVATGVYDVVAQVGGLESVLTAAFTVTAGRGWDFRCRVTAPPLVRPDRPFPVLIEFENTGDSDCPPIMMTVTNDGGFPIWRSRRLQSNLLSVAAVAPVGPTPGYLRPGERGTVAAWSASNNLLCNYTIAWRSTYCQEAIDWDAVETALCPCVNPRWDDIWPAFKAAVGDVDGDYIAAASEAVAEARQYGIVLLDNLEIFQWLLERQEYALDSAAVTGQVRRQGSDDPVGRVEMTLLPRGGGDAVVGQTWHDGRFAFWGLAAGVYDVRIAGVYGGDILSLEVPPGGVLRDAVLLMPAGGAMAGTITDAVTGEPVVEAEIEIRDPYTGVGAQARTDDAGRYHVSGLPPNTVVVRVLPVEHAPLVEEVAGLVAGGTLAWNAVVQPGATVFGEVTAPGGATVAGATILVAPADGSPGRSGRSAEDGTYEIRGLAPGTYRLEVFCKGHGASVVTGVVVPAGGSVERDLALSAPGTLQGHVLDGVSGLPIAGAEIAVSSSGALEPVLSDAAGAFVVGSLPPGPVTLLVSAEGYLPDTQVVTIGAKESIEVRLDRPWSLAGKVLAGVEPVAGLGLYLEHSSGGNVNATTAEDGTFLIEGLRGGDWILVASGPVGEVLVYDAFSLTPVEKDVWKDYAVARGLVRGRIADTAGIPLDGAEVRLARSGAVLAKATSDDQGAFVFEMLVPGSYSLSMAHREVGLARRDGIVVGGGATVDIGTWQPSGRILSVTVTDGAAPLAGAVAELVWLNGLGGERLTAFGDAAGQMAFEYLPEGTYRLNASAPGRARVSQVVAVALADVAVTVALPAEGVVAGRVRAEDGSGVPFALVWASDLSDGETLLTLANAEGEYRLAGLPAQPLSVWVTDHVRSPSTFAVTPVPGAVTEVDVVLATGGAYVSGHVVNPLGLSVGGARCALLTPRGVELRSTLTGSDGLCALGPLPDGDFVLSCTLPGLLPVLTPVTISGADVDLGDILLAEAPGSGGFGGGGKWSIWDWVHGQNPPRRYIKDTPGWRALHQDYWNAYVASGKDCPDAPEAYRQASMSSQSINTRFDAWCLTYAALSGMTGAELNSLAAEIGILTGKISIQIAGLSGAMETMKGPEFLAGISPNAPADLVKAYNDLSFAIDFAVDTMTRLVACLNSGKVDVAEVAFDQFIASVQLVVGITETIAKIALEARGTAGSTCTFLAGGGLGKFLGILGTIKDLYGYWQGLKEKERNILDALKANERANEMYNDMLQRHMGNLSRLAAAIGCDDDDDPPPPPPPPPPWPPPPPGGFPEGGNGPSAAVGRVLSRDPNEKESLGVGAANWVPAGREVTYIIHFENEDDATAPAQTVTITDVLPADLEVGTFEALQISFNGTTVDLPAGTRDYLGSTTVASDPNPVRLRVHLNETTRTVEWVMQSYDPATGELPVDALAGFLPPNDDTGRGEGFVMFRIRPRDGLPTGTGIRNIARIVFDENEAIMTNQIDPHDPSKGTSPDKEALATIDVEGPASRVDDLPAVSPPAIEVSWSGWDDLGGVEGSGAATWTIYVQEDGGAFAPWLIDTPLTGAVYNGVAGRTYGFYSVATDAVGWSEPGKAAAEATTIAGYTVRLEAEANGALADGPVLQIVAPGGSTVPVRAVPAVGYHLEGWWLDGQPGGTANPITLNGVDRDRTLTARFAINQYTLTYLAENGTIGGGAAVQVVNHGSDGAEVTAQPAEGFHFTTWSDGVQTATRRDLAVDGDLTVTAICEINTYSVTFLAGAHGTLAGGPNEVTILVAHGSLCPDAPAVVAEATWVHAGWSPALPAVITGPVQSTAQYVRQTFTLTYLLGANGLAVGPSPQTVVADEDGEPVLAVPAEGSHFVGWSDGEDDNPRTDRDVEGNLTVTALFEVNTYPVTFRAGAHGTLAGGPNEVTTMIAHGSPCPQPPAVTADATWGFTGWSPALPAVITGPVVTTAQYVRLTVTLTYLMGPNGLAVGPSPQVVVPGEDGLPVLAVAAEGYRFAGWSDGEDDNPRTDDEVQNDLTVTAWFVPNNPLPPEGDFVALVGADSLGRYGSIWNLGGVYTMNLGNATLAMRLSHDSQGRLVGNGALQPHAPAAGGVGIPVAIRGTVRGRDGAVVAQLSLTGQRTGLPGQPLARASASGSLNLALDPSRRTLNGRAQLSVILGAERLAISSACVTPLPAPMDGSFRLDLQLDLDGTAVDGAATLTLANGVAYSLIANGVYKDPVSDLTLTPDPSDPAAQGIRLRLVVLTREDRSAVVQSLSGGLGGQVLGGDR